MSKNFKSFNRLKEYSLLFFNTSATGIDFFYSLKNTKHLAVIFKYPVFHYNKFIRSCPIPQRKLTSEFCASGQAT